MGYEGVIKSIYVVLAEAPNTSSAIKLLKRAIGRARIQLIF